MWTVWISGTELSLLQQGKTVEKLLQSGLITLRWTEGGFGITYLTEEEAGLRLIRGQ